MQTFIQYILLCYVMLNYFSLCVCVWMDSVIQNFISIQQVLRYNACKPDTIWNLKRFCSMLGDLLEFGSKQTHL